MKKSLLALVAMAAFGVAHASHPVGQGVTNMSIDSSPCFTWGGNGAAWTRCPVNAPVTVEKIVYVDRPVVVERIVEKIVQVPAPIPYTDKRIPQ